jgi:hypothetical protein
MAVATRGTASNYLQRAPSPSGLADVIDLILDKGLVIDAYVRIAVIGIELITIDARIVIASVDTYLRFAEAVNRLDLTQTEAAGLKELRGVLPLRFGIVLRDEDAVAEELLERRHDELTALLERFARLVELRVKAFYVEEAVLRDIVRSDPAIARLNEATRGLPDASTHPQRVRLGEAVAHALAARRERDAHAIFARLRPLAEDAVVEDTESSLALTASFLVDRGRVAAFDAAMDELAREHEGLMTFKYLGPLPPHSFVSLREEG